MVHGCTSPQWDIQERHSAGDLLDWQPVAERGGLDAEDRGHPIARAERRAKRRNLLRHPGERELSASPFEIDGRGAQTQPEDDPLLRRRHETFVRQRERRADHRVTGEPHLAVRTENPQADVRSGLLRGKKERAFGEVHLAGHACHVVGGEARRIREDSELIARQSLIGKDVVMEVVAPEIQ